LSRFGAALDSAVIANREIVQADHRRAKGRLGLSAAATAVQCWLRAYWMARRSRAYGRAGNARIIDINMGCPAKKVSRAAGFSAWIGADAQSRPRTPR
jgi:tRNA-dihydrouridine synthase